MLKKELNSNKVKAIILIISIILIALVIAAVVLLIPIMSSYILGLVLSSNDGYLLTGLSFCIFGEIIIILVPIILFLLVSKKNNRRNDIKKFIKNYKVVFIVIILLIIIFESIIGYRGYTYFKDIKEGPQEAIMMDAIVKRKYSYKSSYTYIAGYIDNEEIQLEITRDARSKVSRNKKYKMVKIKYYKNIKEVYDVDIYISYIEDK